MCESNIVGHYTIQKLDLLPTQSWKHFAENQPIFTCTCTYKMTTRLLLPSRVLLGGKFSSTCNVMSIDVELR